MVVSTYYGGYTVPTGVTPAIYDNGAARPSVINFGTYAPFPYALIVDGTRNEIYGPGDVNTGSNNYNTYSYGPTGITLKQATVSSLNFGANHYSVTSNGLVHGSYPYYTGTSLQYQNCYKLNGGFLYAEAGGIADVSITPPVQVGVFEDIPTAQTYAAPAKDFEVDTSLGLAFYFNSGSQYSSTRNGITAFSTQTYLPVGSLPLPFSTLEATTGFTGVDMVRWGQDGLAVLSGSGKVYLVRGAAIVPGVLRSNAAATLSGASSISAAVGSGNMLLTLTGTHFLPGVAVLWNGVYHTTTLVDSSHLTVAIPASDLSQVGVATMAAKNPGATSSNTVLFTIR